MGKWNIFLANSMYAASQAGVHAISPYVEALVPLLRIDRQMGTRDGRHGFSCRWSADDDGRILWASFRAGTRMIRITTNLQIYWDSIR